MEHIASHIQVRGMELACRRIQGRSPSRESHHLVLSLFCLKSLSAQSFQDKAQRLVSAYIPSHSFNLMTHPPPLCHMHPLTPPPTYVFSLSHTNTGMSTFSVPSLSPSTFSLHLHLFLPSLPTPHSVSSLYLLLTFYSCLLHIPHLFPSLFHLCVFPLSFYISPTYLYMLSFTHTYTFTHTHPQNFKHAEQFVFSWKHYIISYILQLEGFLPQFCLRSVS